MLLQLFVFFRALPQPDLQRVPVFDESLNVLLQQVHSAFELCVDFEHIDLVVLLCLELDVRLLKLVISLLHLTHLLFQLPLPLQDRLDLFVLEVHSLVVYFTL